MKRKKEKKGVSKIDKSQTFSLDIMIALGIFIIGIVVFLFLIGGNQDKKSDEKVIAEAELLPNRLIAEDEYSTTNTTIVVGNKVDSELLNKNIAKNYSDVKRELEVVSDFCLHFQNDEGELVDLDDSPCWVQYSMGDSRLMLTIIEGGNEITIPCGNRTYVC